MLLKNNVARLITINGTYRKKVVKIDLMPAGDAVDVPDSIAGTAYVQSLIDAGDVLVIGEPAAKPAKEEAVEVDARTARRSLLG